MEWLVRNRRLLQKDIITIGSLIEAEEFLGRSHLSRRLCRLWDWRQTNGAYRKFMGLMDGLVPFCPAHLIRDLKFLAEHPNPMIQIYGQPILRAFRRMFHLIHEQDQEQEGRELNLRSFLVKKRDFTEFSLTKRRAERFGFIHTRQNIPPGHFIRMPEVRGPRQPFAMGRRLHLERWEICSVSMPALAHSFGRRTQ